MNLNFLRKSKEYQILSLLLYLKEQNKAKIFATNKENIKTEEINMKRIILIFVVLLAMIGQVAYAQKTCVIASAEDHVPIREALIHTNNNHWARTDYRGYWTMRYQFDSATVSKPGYVKATIRYKELPDTVFLLPEAKQLGEVTVWGKNQENVGKVKSQACQEAVEAGRNAALGHTRLVGFDLGNVMDSQGRRDQKHLKEARKVFSKMENNDPLINAYEKATGKKYELKNPINLSANKKETLEKQDETRQESSEKTLPNVQNEAKEQENEK